MDEQDEPLSLAEEQGNDLNGGVEVVFFNEFPWLKWPLIKTARFILTPRPLRQVLKPNRSIRLPPFQVQTGRSRPIWSHPETSMTTTTLPTPMGLVTRDGEGHGNVYAKEPPMTYAARDAAWGFHERAEKLNGRLAMLGFVAAIATELITGEGLLRAIGL